jgi:hypothetical protein
VIQHWIFDYEFQPRTDTPSRDWPGWEVRYDNDCERGKRTTRDLSTLPGHLDVLGVLRRSAEVWSRRLGYDVTDDPTLHGGGLHVTEPGGHLQTHLDYDLHPLVPGKRRALNLIAFLHAIWEPTWGGALVLCDPSGTVTHRIEPTPGRLVAFEVSDLSYHGVEPVTGPADRVSVAAYFLSDAGPRNTRRRALFVPRR